MNFYFKIDLYFQIKNLQKVLLIRRILNKKNQGIDLYNPELKIVLKVENYQVKADIIWKVCIHLLIRESKNI